MAWRAEVPGGDRFERSVRWWLRAYPVRWRSVRGDEVVDLLRDVAGPGAARLSLWEGLGLVRAGWATRWRTGPPLRVRLAYRWGTRAIPPQYREWARDDITGRWFLTRQWMSRMWMIVLIATWSQWRHPDVGLLWMWGFTCAFVVVSDLLRTSRAREAAVRQHLVPAPGEPVVPGGFVRSWLPRRRLDARGGIDASCALLGLGAIAWGGVALSAPHVVGLRRCAANCVETTTPGRPGLRLAFALVSALVGVAFSRLAARRLARLTPQRPAQPGRVLVGAAAGQLLGLALVVTGAAVQAWLEATGRMPAVVAPVAAPACLVLLPGALVVRRFVAATPCDLAFADLVRIGMLGELPRLDAVRPWVARAPVTPVTH